MSDDFSIGAEFDHVHPLWPQFMAKSSVNVKTLQDNLQRFYAEPYNSRSPSRIEELTCSWLRAN